MKKNYLSKLRALFVLGAMLSANVVANAQIGHLDIRNHGVQNSPIRSSLIYDESKLMLLEDHENVLVPKLAPPRKDDENTVNVEILLDQERPEYSVWCLVITDVNARKLYTDRSFDLSSCPVGTYDFIMMADVSSGGTALVFKENVEVKKDTAIVFNLSEANNKINPDIYKRNGERVKPLLFQDNGEEYEIIEEGDEVFCVWSFSKINTEGNIVSNFANQMSTKQENSDITFYVNDASENYSIAYEGSIFDDGELCVFANGTNTMQEQVLTNKAEDFVWYEEQFALPPNFGQNDKDGTISCDYYLTVEGVHRIGLNTQIVNKLAKDGKVGLYVNCPSSMANGDIELLVRPMLCDEYEIFDSGIENYVFQKGTPAKVGKSRIEYVVTQDQAFSPNTMTEEGRRLASYYPGHPAFSFTNDNKSLPYSENCSIASVDFPYFNNGSFKQISWTSRGRHGEVRDGINNYDEIIKLDGKVIVEGVRNNWLLMQETMGIDQGVIDFELTNHNVYVDGLQGKNTVIMQYDFAREDNLPPTLTMLQFRKTNGDVTDRFETAADGIVTFSGGDKINNYDLYGTISFYTIGSITTVEVSYSPFNKDEWQALEGIEELPEYYYYPEYGYFYHGSLKDVTGAGEKGWFDLKIRLEDVAGNWQEQVISPAFRIDDLVDTGIGNNNQYTITNNNAVYDLMGRRMESQQKGISIVRRANGDVRKVVVK